MDSSANILEGSEPEAAFAAANKISQRTSARYRNQPNGMPWFEWGGRVYIPIEPAREWLKARIRRPNPRRKAA